MKRITAAIGAVAAAAIIGGTAAFAAEPGRVPAGAGYVGGSNAVGGCYTDSDGDGFCDHYYPAAEGDTFNGCRPGARHQESGHVGHLSGHRGEHRSEHAGGHHQADCIWR